MIHAPSHASSQRRHRPIASALATALCITVVGISTGCADAQRGADINKLYQAHSAYDSGDLPRAARLAGEFVAASPRGSDAGRAYYVRALIHAREGRRSAAYDDLNRALEASDDADVRWRALAQRGVMRFEDERWAEAGADLESAIERMPRSARMDWFLYRLGQALERTGRWADARAKFQRVISEFPTGPVTANARRRVALNLDHFSIQCGVFQKKDNAARVAADLGRQRLASGVYRETRPEGEHWVVRVGRYATYAEAQAALAQVRTHVADAVIWP
ncbi:MAG: SPOR domain-containing protein [Phycisphaerales bacterium]|nr:SPOR domain-containing protein [Phycisphaerales bacterium]